MKITSLKRTACVLTVFGLTLGGISARDNPQTDASKKDSQAQSYDKNTQAAGQYGKTAIGAPLPHNKVSALLGMAVHDQNGEKIGDIKDLAIDMQGNRVAYAVFGTDGKERLFAIPLNAFQTGDNQRHVVLSIDKTKYESAKGFEKDSWPGLNADFQYEMFWTAPSTTASVSTEAYVDQAAARPSLNTDASKDGAVQSDSPEFSSADRSQDTELSPTGKDSATRGSYTVQEHNKASKLLGMNIENQLGENLGEIKDLVVDFQSGKISYAVLAYGGRLGIGQKMLAVPLTAFTLGTEGKGLVLNADKSKLEMAQGFDKNQWPSVSNPTWGADKFWEDKSGTSRQDLNP